MENGRRRFLYPEVRPKMSQNVTKFRRIFVRTRRIFWPIQKPFCKNFGRKRDILGRKFLRKKGHFRTEIWARKTKKKDILGRKKDILGRKSNILGRKQNAKTRMVDAFVAGTFSASNIKEY